jgi:aspartyl-tRNA(Asn)/glutamyl-tRNA(Gln) amidotransferase subunit C
LKLSREEVLHIAKLARVGVTEDEIDKFWRQLSDILEKFEVLSGLTPSIYLQRPAQYAA